MDRWLLFGVLSLVALLSAPAAASADPALPDGFSKVTVATGLWDATAFAYTPDGRVIIVEKRGRVAVAHPGVSLATNADRHRRPRRRGRRPRAAGRCRRPAVRHQPLRLPALHLTRPLDSPCAQDVPPDAHPGQPGRHRGEPDGPRDRAARQGRRRRAVSAARQRSRLHPVEQRLAFDRHRAGGRGRHAVGRLGRRPELQHGGSAGPAHLQRAELLGQDDPCRPAGQRAARAPVLPDRQRPHPRLHEALRQGLPQPVPVHPSRRQGAGGRRRRLEHARGGRPPPARHELRLALLRGLDQTPGYENDSRCATLYSQEGTPAGATPPHLDCDRNYPCQTLLAGPT